MSNKAKPNIYQKLQNLRVEIQEKPLNKSGFNKFANFNYFELKDFLAESNKLMQSHGLTPVFNVLGDNATLTLFDHDSELFITFTTPVGQAMKSAIEIQDIGARHTYAKRYLYMNALELAENDMVDATIGKTEAPKTNKQKAREVDQSPVTNEQILAIQKRYSADEINRMLSAKIFNGRSLFEITQGEAERMINAREIKKN